MAADIGRTISHYRIIAKLGQGGMGAVFAAEDLQLRRHVALKFLPPELVSDLQARKRLIQEARTASRLNHPNIATIYEVSEADETSFIVMEQVHGESLKQMLARGALEPQRLMEIACQIAEGLNEAHQSGVLHRDIKPGNIMVDHKGRAKILDFGLAVSAGRERVPEETLESYVTRTASQWSTGGTVPYMSPEQLRGEPTDVRSEIFSFGVLLYECLTGRLPFHGETSIDTLHAILHQPLMPLRRLLPKIPGEWERLVERCLAKSPEQRYRSMAEVLEALRRIGAPASQSEKSLAVLYFENLCGAKEDEYFRDGMTEDIITELLKIKGLNVFPRPAVTPFRDKPVTATEVGRQLNAAHVLAGSIRRAGNRLRVTAQLVEAHTGFPVWAERYDREMNDIFEVQDEIARSITQALRITLSPQEEKAIAHKPTENTQAYDFYLRGRSYARRVTRQDLEFAMQMFHQAIQLDPGFALAHAGIANVCGQIYLWSEQNPEWVEKGFASCEQALALEPQLAEALAARAQISWAQNKYDDAIEWAQRAIERKSDCDGAYWTLGQALYTCDRWQEAAALVKQAVESNGDNYNVYIPYVYSLERLGQVEAARALREKWQSIVQQHLQMVPDDVRARTMLANQYAISGDRKSSIREIEVAVALRPKDASVLYNAACVYGILHCKAEALSLLKRAKECGLSNWDWIQRDPDLAWLRDQPEFQQLISEGAPEA